MEPSNQYSSELKKDELQHKLKPYVWFVGLWMGGFIAVSLLAYGFRFLAGLAYA
jgi:hypothetical protein